MVNIYIQGQLLDQYDDEVIEITSSVLDVSDLTKNTGDFSKTFTIPASPTNNKHFKHWYNASIDNGFDARTKVDGHIDIDGIPFKTGKWRLSEAIFKDGVVDGYVINFFGKLPNIKDTIGDDKLSDLNLVEHDHEWTGANVELGLTGDLNSSSNTQRELVYTPISSKRYFYDSNPISGDIGDNVNIAAQGNGSGIVWNDLRPSLKAKTIIDAIQHKYGTGTNQSVNILVTSPTVTSGNLSVTLNGIETGFSLPASTSLPNTASSIKNSINSSSELSGLVVATSTGNLVTITSVGQEQEINPTYSSTGSSLVIDMYVRDVGAYAYEDAISFTDDFFQTSEFEQMYLWLKRDDDENIGLVEFPITWATGDLSGIDSATNTITYTSNLVGATWTYDREVFKTVDASGYQDIPFTLVRKIKTTLPSGEIVYSTQEIPSQVNSDGTVSGMHYSIYWRNASDYGTTTYEVQYFIRANTNFKIGARLERTPVTHALPSAPVEGSTTLTFAPTTGAVNQSIVSVSNMMPDMKIVDFLKGIFDMFKLVVIPQNDGSMYVNSLDSFYSQGNRHDISDKIDYSSFKVKRGELYQSISYQFEDPTTILNEEFKNRSRDGQGYGSSLVNVYESIRPIKLIDGEKVEIKLPFEQVVYERLTDSNSNTGNEPLNFSVATITDKDLKPITPKPILHYISEQDLTLSGTRIKFETDNNVSIEFNDRILVPMNQFGTIEPEYSLLFESEFSSWNGEQLENNLYSIHHRDYIEAVFRLKRRTFEYEALLPNYLVTRLGLNDVLTIEGIDYRINKYKHNLLSGKTKLELVNGFDTRIDGGVFIPSTINMSKFVSTQYFNVPRANSDYSQAKVDVGFGTSWLTIGVFGQNDNMMQIRANSENVTASDRSCIVRYTNLVTGIITDINVTQLNG